MIVRHYGSNKYDPTKFRPIADRSWVKPSGGLWTSPLDSKYGWVHWCKENDYSECLKHFDLVFSGKAFVIDSVSDVRGLQWGHHPKCEMLVFPLWQPLLRAGYDAVHLTVSGERATRFSAPCSLYGWDCETLLILNPASISPICNPRQT